MSVNDGIQEWWNAVPIATRYMFSGAGILTLAANFQLISAMRLVWIPSMIYQNFEIWRPITAFFYFGGFGFPMIMKFVFLLQYSKNLELGRYGGRLADYVFMLLFGCSIILLVASFIPGAFVLSDGLIMLMIYVWVRTNPDQIVSFLFGIRFKAAFLPWVLIGFHFLLGDFPILYIVGALVGHLYIYLKDIYPAVTGKYYLHTPQFLINFLPPGTGVNAAGGVQQPHVQVPQGHRWGQGHALGGR